MRTLVSNAKRKFASPGCTELTTACSILSRGSGFRQRCFAGFSLFFLCLPPVAGRELPSPPSREPREGIRALHLEDPVGGRTFLLVGKQGKLYLGSLRTRTLWELSSAAPPRQVDDRWMPAAFSADAIPLEVAGSASLDRLAILEFPPRLRSVSSEKELALPPLAELATSVMYLGDSLVVALAPVGFTLGSGRDLVKSARSSASSLPLLVELSGSQWRTIAFHEELIPISELTPSGSLPLEAIAAWYGVLLAPGREGTIWVAWRYRNRIRLYDRNGKVRFEWTAPQAEPEFEKLSTEELDAKRQQAAEGRLPGSPPQLRPKVRFWNLCEGPHQRLYLLASAPSGVTLLKLDPHSTEPVVESVPLLDFQVRSAKARTQMACGAEGIFLARQGDRSEGIGFLPWESLEQASWKREGSSPSSP